MNDLYFFLIYPHLWHFHFQYYFFLTELTFGEDDAGFNALLREIFLEAEPMEDAFPL